MARAGLLFSGVTFAFWTFTCLFIGNVQALPNLSKTGTSAEQDIAESGEWNDGGSLQDLGIPVNISGRFRGSWKRLQMDGALADVDWLQQDGGQVDIQLRASPTSTKGVQNVEGEMAFREGLYLAEEPELLKLAGVYVAATGRLHAQADLAGGPIVIPLAGNASDVVDTQDYRTALRNKASMWTEPSRQPPLFYFLRADTLEYLNRMDKGCEFVLDLGVHYSAGQDANQEVGSALASNTTPGQTTGERRKDPARGLQEADWVLNGTLASPNCGALLSMNLTITHVEKLNAKSINYTLMMTAVAFLQVLLLMRQMDGSDAPAAAAKVSLLMLGQQAILDALLCLAHLTAGIVVEDVFNAFAVAAFFEFVVFAIFEMRYLLLVWRARRANALDPWAAQRELSVLYARFYGVLLAGVFLGYHLHLWLKILIFPLYAFWIPQIVFCARHDVRQPLRPAYIIGVTLTRLALPLYLFGCPHNLLGWQPRPGVCLGLCAFMAVQVAVLLVQTRWGPRCFIPKRFLPAKYDYHRRAPARPPQAPDEAQGPRDIETGDAGVECVICMNPLDIERTSARMVTPCNHFFHPDCLNRWMDVKMECPTCRQLLPPP
ncbi:g2115 [Coccomyxa elongata]